MKKGIFVLLLLSVAGCMFIVRDGEDIKSVGISKAKAQVEVTALEGVIAAEQAKDAPLGEKSK